MWIFRLLRIGNLAFIALIMYFMRHFIVFPLLDNFPIMRGNQLNIYQLEMQLPWWPFLALVLGVVFIAAAGNVINDYFDVSIDLLNKPEKTIISKKITPQNAKLLYYILSSIGIACGFYVSWFAGVWQLGIIFLAAAGALWYYSASYKKQFLVGNIVIALLAALVPFMAVVYEIPLLLVKYKEVVINYHISFYHILLWGAGFAFFAFLTTLIREILKDTQDFEGDFAMGCDSIPIVLGTVWTKVILCSLSLFTASAIYYAYYNLLNDTVTLWFAIAMMSLFAVLLVLILKSDSKHDYRFAANFTKVIMLTGMSYAPLAYYIMMHM